MACLCSLQLGALLNTLPAMPSTAGLVPPMPPGLVAAISASRTAPTALASASAGGDGGGLCAGRADREPGRDGELRGGRARPRMG